MKKVLSAVSAIGYILISGVIITILLLSFVDISNNDLQSNRSAEIQSTLANR